MINIKTINKKKILQDMYNKIIPRGSESPEFYYIKIEQANCAGVDCYKQSTQPDLDVTVDGNEDSMLCSDFCSVSFICVKVDEICQKQWQDNCPPGASGHIGIYIG